MGTGNGSLDVTIVLGSRSDLPIAEKAVKVLKDFGISYQLRVASAHRAPKYLEGIVTKAEKDGCKVCPSLVHAHACMMCSISYL